MLLAADRPVLGNEPLWGQRYYQQTLPPIMGSLLFHLADALRQTFGNKPGPQYSEMSI